MNIDEFTKSLAQTLKERFASPLTGSLVMSWLAWNYKLVLVLLSSKTVEDKIIFIEFLLYDNSSEATLHLLWGPLLTATFLVALYPALSLAGYATWAWWERWFRKIQAALDNERNVPRAELNRWRQETLDEFSRLNRELEQKNAYVDQARRIDEEQKALISSLQERLREIDLNTYLNEADKKDSSIVKMLLENAFTLVFNPASPRGEKRMLFGPSGAILEGRNANEFSWQVQDGYVDLLNEKGEVHNRFTWHPAVNEFVALDNGEYPAIMGQRLRPKH